MHLHWRVWNQTVNLLKKYSKLVSVYAFKHLYVLLYILFPLG